MPRIGFEAPGHIHELVAILNRSGKWRVTLVDSGGKIYGHYATEYGRTRDALAGTGDNVLIYNGDIDDTGHPLFATDTDEGAVVFLYGLYLGTFGERSLESIQDEIMHRPELIP